MGKCGSERAELDPATIKIESFATARDEPAVGIRLPGIVELSMTPYQALVFGCRICTAAVMAESFGILGQSVVGPRDGEVMGAIVGGALEILLAERLGGGPPTKSEMS